ncbi:GyrI-like domain-containing protein [Pseudoduganella plicata]|nr:AraC family transcriptional regulator [Pseudoduganella plicata]
MTISIIMLPELKLAALQFAGPFSVLGTEMPKVWQRLLSREEEVGTGTGVRYGASMAEHDGIMLENIAVQLADLNALPKGFVGLRIPPCRYALTTHTGPMSGVQDTYLRAFDAIADASLIIDHSAWRLERYDNRFTPTVDAADSEQNAYDILIPLQG